LFVSDSLTVRDSTLKKLEPEKGYAGADSLASNPDVELYRQKWATQQAESKAAQSQSWPDPFFRYSRRDFTGNGSFSAIELGLRIPLDIWAEKGRNQAAELGALEAFQNYREVENDRITTYQNTLENLETYSRQLEYFEESRLKEAKMIIKSASKQYRAGNIDYVQYINYFDQATRIRLNYLDILKTYNQNTIELEYLLGE
jgi:cobalt-zinc-cadmium resistance protein CzcA